MRATTASLLVVLLGSTIWAWATKSSVAFVIMGLSLVGICSVMLYTALKGEKK